MKSLEHRTHGLRATYRAGCRCPECRRARLEYDHATLFNQCPTCPGQKSKRARRCADCAAVDPFNLANLVAARSEAITPADVKTQGNPAWRPDHYPPACQACNGFGYTKPNWSSCHACKASPGHAMTFNDWTTLRA